MGSDSDQARIDAFWDEEAMPTLLDYICIPCESPAFDPSWADSGHMDRAADMLAAWARKQLASVDAAVEVVRLPGRTPTIFIEIAGNAAAPVLIYGHYDKQPPMTGWASGRSAWRPTREGERLYGRGGADDGYALFSAVTAVLALRERGIDHLPVRILIEGSEESGSGDLESTIEHLADRLGTPDLIVALDAGCGNYDQLWTTTSLRGQVAGTLSVRTLRQGVHSGDASGIVPSSFRIARHLLSRIEDPATGRIVDPAFHVEIPQERRAEAARAGNALGDDIHRSFPFVERALPVIDDPAEQLLNRAWRPQLCVTGCDGLPPVAEAAPVLHPATTLKLSLRLPPTLDPDGAAMRLKAVLEADPPYGSEVTFTINMVSRGWNAPPVGPSLGRALEKASLRAFGRGAATIGGGGGIPFLAMLGERFPSAQFLVTGLLGPESNAHGPNEFLHLPTARRLTAALSDILGALGDDR